jgi:hypothetical protein
MESVAGALLGMGGLRQRLRLTKSMGQSSVAISGFAVRRFCETPESAECIGLVKREILEG